MNKKAQDSTLQDSEDFKALVDLMALYTDATNRIKALEADANGEFIDILDEKKAEYAKLQQALTTAETALEVLTLKHPEWFVTRKSIKTPFGTVKLTKSTKLEVANEEVTILLIQQAIETAKLRGEIDNFSQLIRTRTELDLEAIEKLDANQLAQFRIKRVSNDNFSVVPATIDMGKAVKEAAEKEAA